MEYHFPWTDPEDWEYLKLVTGVFLVDTHMYWNGPLSGLCKWEGDLYWFHSVAENKYAIVRLGTPQLDSLLKSKTALYPTFTLDRNWIVATFSDFSVNEGEITSSGL